MIAQHQYTHHCPSCRQFLLSSCAGFPAAPVHLWCCTTSACTAYDQAAVADLGFDVGPLAPLRCYAADEPEPVLSRTGGSDTGGSDSFQRVGGPIIGSDTGGSDRFQRVGVPVIVTVVVLLVAALFGRAVCCCRRGR